MLGGVDSVCAGVGESRELAEDCHVQFCPCEFTTLAPVALDRLCRECAAAGATGQVTTTTISEESLNLNSFLSLQVLCVALAEGQC